MSTLPFVAKKSALEVCDEPPSLRVELLTPEESGVCRPQLEAAQKKLGFVPNMYAIMAHSPDLFSTYLQGYQGVRASCGFSPAEQETVFLAISVANGCDYCVAAHSMIGEKVTKVPERCLEALRTGGVLPDHKLNVLAEFTREMVANNGRVSKPQLEAFVDAGFGQAQALGVVLAMSVKTLSNSMNHLFNTPLDDAFSPFRVV